MSRFTATEIIWSGLPAIRLADVECDTTATLVPSLGGNLISLTSQGEELLRTPPDAATLAEKPARWGIPVLMPPNRIRGGRFQFGGREYQLELTDSAGGNHIHGFPLRRPWKLVTTNAAGKASVTVAFDAAEHPDVLAQFPHPFVLTLTYTLVGQSLHCSPHIANPGEEPMPFGLGFHPYLLAPVSGEHQIRLTPPARVWELAEWLPTGSLLPAEGVRDLSTWQPLHGVEWGTGYALVQPEPAEWSRFELADRASGRVITFRADPAYRHWLIFNGFEGSVSPEPYTCMTDAFNLELPPEVSGMAVIAPGTGRSAGEWELTWE